MARLLADAPAPLAAREHPSLVDQVGYELVALAIDFYFPVVGRPFAPAEPALAQLEAGAAALLVEGRPSLVRELVGQAIGLSAPRLDRT